MAFFKQNAALSEEIIRSALSQVIDPDLKKDLVTLGMIKDILIDAKNGAVSFRVVLTTPACPLKAKIESDCRQAVTAVPGVQSIQITMDAQVRAQTQTVSAGGIPPSQRIPGVAHIIAVSSGKGGVGKSTVAVNLAAALALEGARVGLMDADVYGPNIPTMMGIIDQPQCRDDVFIPVLSYGVKVMSIGFLLPKDQPVVWRGPMLHSVVKQFCHQVEWGELDYLIVDMPPGTGDVQLSLSQLVPVTGAVLVTTPQEVSMQDVRKAFGMFEKVKIPILGFVENMSYFQCSDCEKRHFLFGEGGGKLLAKKFFSELLGELPLVPSVREGGDEGCPIVIRDRDSLIAQALRNMSKKVAQQVSILENKPSPQKTTPCHSTHA